MSTPQTPHLVWVGQISNTTGLGRVSEQLLSRLAQHWRISVVAIGLPKNYSCPYAEVLDARAFEDWLGHLVYWRLCQDDPPDVTVLFMDPEPAMSFLPARHPSPLIAYCPIDAGNIKEAHRLAEFARCIFLTRWGLKEAQRCGFPGTGEVLWHGVHTARYRPQDQQEARWRLGLPPDAFLVGNVNRNQPRKRIDLTLLAFQAFSVQVPEAVLYLHMQPQDMGWDLSQLLEYLMLRGRVVLPPVRADGMIAVPEADMPWVYSALDVQMSTTAGEGFGLTHLEGAACGVPQLVPAHPSLLEWAGEAFLTVPLAHGTVTTGGSNLVMWAPEVEATTRALHALAVMPSVRQYYAQAGLRMAQQPCFQWDSLAQQLHGWLLEAVATYG